MIIDFLNSLLVGEKCIRDIHFLDKELLPEYDEGRGVIYDIHCVNDDGEQFIVEMQNKKQANFHDRALYYLSRAISWQGEKGVSWNFDIKAVYGIFFMNFMFDIDGHRVRTDIDMVVRQTGNLYSDKMRMIFLELPSFTKEENECEDDFERWMYVLKNMETLDRMPFKARKAVFDRLEQIIDLRKMTVEEHERYDASINAYRTQLAVMDYAREEGFEEGLKEGFEEGAAMNSRKIALKMRQMGMSENLIMEMTGLSIDEIRELQ